MKTVAVVTFFSCFLVFKIRAFFLLLTGKTVRLNKKIRWINFRFLPISTNCWLISTHHHRNVHRNVHSNVHSNVHCNVHSGDKLRNKTLDAHIEHRSTRIILNSQFSFWPIWSQLKWFFSFIKWCSHLKSSKFILRTIFRCTEVGNFEFEIWKSLFFFVEMNKTHFWAYERLLIQIYWVDEKNLLWI